MEIDRKLFGKRGNISATSRNQGAWITSAPRKYNRDQDWRKSRKLLNLYASVLPLYMRDISVPFRCNPVGITLMKRPNPSCFHSNYQQESDFWISTETGVIPRMYRGDVSEVVRYNGTAALFSGNGFPCFPRLNFWEVQNQNRGKDFSGGSRRTRA